MPCLLKSSPTHQSGQFRLVQANDQAGAAAKPAHACDTEHMLYEGRKKWTQEEVAQSGMLHIVDISERSLAQMIA